ncbi:PP2C family protein-serine/threonine phosphatase [Yinghuangia seranimata]|uniref:PP2C family protein-serine/threonine phosphatase n=1 Tax=Yinghuangia seranimata TaxID=408067 RepID=UPI00248C5A5C|nr:PP2C family protein-serine/threonine phosphatase [Yinghuangia seranimata]MDI2125864.1 PP2C family protein-serine/threonine phosphatase [Yinghuangia seranimata]
MTAAPTGRSASEGTARWLILALTAVYTLGVVVADLVGPYEVHLHSALVALPALVALTYRARWTLAAGALAIGVSVALHFRGDAIHEAPLRSIGIFWAILVVTAVGCVASRDRTRHTAQLRQVRSVAEVAQRAVLRPVPETLGGLRLHVRYQAAAAEARIGGDLYEVLDTPYGVRLLLGDVRGKGLEAVETAAVVLGAFREAAYDHAKLSDVAERVEVSLRRHLGSEDFVTALLAEFPAGGGVRIAAYGHEPPLLARDGRVSRVALGREQELPFGLHGVGPDAEFSPLEPETLPFGPGDRLLLYTDGAGEARDAGDAFFPVEAAFARHHGGPPERVLAGVHEDLLRHVGGHLHDDTALLLVSA